jgi:hypothetical protein
MLRKMRDLDIRLALHSLLREEHEGDRETLILDELGLCQGTVRADVAVINGSLAGFEIKSDSDTLERLPRQAEIYGRVFDYVTLIVGKKHARGISKRVPRYWGIVVVSQEGGELVLRRRRTAKRNRGVDPYAVARLLWRDEALEILTARGLDEGLRGKPRRVLWQALAVGMPAEELAQEVRKTLRAREDWRSDRPRSRCGDSSRSSAKS